MIPASGKVFAENEKVRLCVVKESEKQDYIALSYTYSCMKSAFKDEEFVEDLWNGFIYGKSFTCTVYDQKSGDYVGYCAIKDIERKDKIPQEAKEAFPWVLIFVEKMFYNGF